METKFSIDNSGMGSFLNPPGHAEHDYSVVEKRVYGPKRDNEIGCYSLNYVLECNYIPENVKQEARQLLAENPGQFTTKWEHTIYNYFRNCYSPDGIDRNVSNLADKGPPNHHLAVLHIQHFFPSHQPNLQLIESSGELGNWHRE